MKKSMIMFMNLIMIMSQRMILILTATAGTLWSRVIQGPHPVCV